LPGRRGYRMGLVGERVLEGSGAALEARAAWGAAFAAGGNVEGFSKITREERCIGHMRCLRGIAADADVDGMRRQLEEKKGKNQSRAGSKPPPPDSPRCAPTAGELVPEAARNSSRQTKKTKD
jgi:hypothetical protein